MKKILIVFVIAGVIFACNQGNKGPVQIAGSGTFCDSTVSDNPCSIIPIDVHEQFRIGYLSNLDSAAQQPIDTFSWKTFIALNWPADSAGHPIGKSIADLPNAPRVWERYMDPAAIFGYSTPGLTLRLAAARQNVQKFLYLDSKAPQPLLTGTTINLGKLNGFEEADGHPLIDRNLNFVLYEIKMNPIESKFVLDSNLNTYQGIYKWASKNKNAIIFPASDVATKNVGSMEIKAAWRILIPALGDDTTRYYCRRATIYVDSAHTRNHKPLILTNVKVGLVGMHIIRKTDKLSQKELWSTFEQVDNVPDNIQEAQESSKKWSFYNDSCLNCVPNAAPVTFKGDNGKYIWETKMPYAHKYGVKAPGQALADSFGTQAVRVYPIYKYTQMINKVWREKLKGTVWANYRLVGSQWFKSTGPNGPTAPNFLANTTLETYIQCNASCISCHSFAAILYNNNKDTVTTDLSFIFPSYVKNPSLRKTK
jgi:hypothetical protein